MEALLKAKGIRNVHHFSLWLQ